LIQLAGITNNGPNNSSRTTTKEPKESTSFGELLQLLNGTCDQDQNQINPLIELLQAFQVVQQQVVQSTPTEGEVSVHNSLEIAEAAFLQQKVERHMLPIFQTDAAFSGNNVEMPNNQQVKTVDDFKQVTSQSVKTLPQLKNQFQTSELQYVISKEDPKELLIKQATKFFEKTANQENTSFLQHDINQTPKNNPVPENLPINPVSKYNDKNGQTGNKENPYVNQDNTFVFQQITIQSPNNDPSLQNNKAAEGRVFEIPVRADHLSKDIINVFQNDIHMQNGKEGLEATFILKPEHLGKVDVKVSIKDGNVTAEFFTNTTNGKHLLEANVQTLKMALEQHGFQVDKIDISQQTINFTETYTGRGDSGQQTRQGQYGSKKRNGYAEYNQEDDLADLAGVGSNWVSQINTTA
jgi:flagellar hook-length control protein FliK